MVSAEIVCGAVVRAYLDGAGGREARIGQRLLDDLREIQVLESLRWGRHVTPHHAHVVHLEERLRGQHLRDGGLWARLGLCKASRGAVNQNERHCSQAATAE